MPSEDEWYKAAYHQNDGPTANYWDYATGSNCIPDGLDTSSDTAFDAVFFQGYDQRGPNGVTNVGVASSYGTFGQTGNVWEWQEDASVGPNDVPSEARAIRGGHWGFFEFGQRSSYRDGGDPTLSFDDIGFRVASVPEPSSAMLFLGSSLLFLLQRSRRPSR